jgi:MFS family permease
MSDQNAFGLLQQKRFAPLLGATALGAFNDNFFRYALVTLVAFGGMRIFGLERDLLVPIAASLFTLPIFLFSAIAGRLADKVDRTKIMRFAKFAEIWLMLIVAAGFFLEQAELLMIALFLMGIQSAFFSPAKNSALPTLLTANELVPANALLSGSLNVSVLLGIGLGTFLVTQSFGPEIVGVGLVFMAILGWLSMRQLPSAPASNPDMPLTINFIGETFRVLGFAVKNPDVLRPLLGAAWFWMLAASIITLMPIFTASVLGADESAVLLFSALFTVGAAIGAITCGTLSGRGDALGFSIAGANGLVIFTTDLALYTWSNALVTEGAPLVNAVEFAQNSENWRILVDLGLAAISAGLFVVPLQAMAQRRAAPELRGRLLAAGGIINAATATMGQFSLAAIAVLNLPIQSAFLLIAGISLLVAIITTLRLRARKKKPLDSPS